MYTNKERLYLILIEASNIKYARQDIDRWIDLYEETGRSWETDPDMKMYLKRLDESIEYMYQKMKDIKDNLNIKNWTD